MTMTVTMGKKERNQEIVKLYDAGLTYQQIGDMFSLTRERIRQILNSMNYSRKRGNGQLIPPEQWAIDAMREACVMHSFTELKKDDELSREEHRAVLYLQRKGEYGKLARERNQMREKKQERRLRELLDAGLTQKEIAKEMGLSFPYITNLKQRHGLLRKQLSLETYRALHTEGLTIKQIAQRLDRSENMVRVALKRLELT